MALRPPPTRAAAFATALVTMTATVALSSTAASAADRVTLGTHGTAVPAGAHRDGALAGDHSVHVAVALKPYDETGLDRFVAAVSDPGSPAYRHYLTSTEYNRLFAPRRSEVYKVEAFLRHNGLRVTHVSGNRQVVDATGTADAVETAFDTRLSRYTGAHGRHFYANDTAASVPASLAPTVRTVVGLTNHPAAHPGRPATKRSAGPAGPTGPGGGYTPAQFRTAYGMSTLSGSYDGSGQTVGLIEFDAFKQSDLDAWTSHYNQPSVTPRIVSVDGGVSGPGSNQLEVTLDVEAVAATAPGAGQVVYEAPNSDSAWVDEMARIASDNAITVLSNSWLLGEKCESDPIKASHDSYTQLAAQGVTLLSASGDWGATGCGYNGDNSTIQADYPPSDPLFTGVGGTQLRTGDDVGTYQSESCWNQGSSGNTRSGGGYSIYYDRPDWQPGSNRYRSVPDVAMDADYGTGALSVYMNGGWEDVGGTSLSSPLWAGYIAMVDQKARSAGKNDLGVMNPTIYSIAGSSQYSSTFHDVTTGDNGTYDAGQGYDLCTGWGSMKGDNLAQSLIDGARPPAANDFSITADPSSVSVDPGRSVTTTISTTVTKGDAQTVALSAGGLPSGVMASFDPTSVTAGRSSTLTLTASTSASPGTAEVTVTGEGSDASHGTTVSLTVNGSNPPGGDVTVQDPGFQFSQHGQDARLAMHAGGGTGSYTWSATGLPTGLSIDPVTGVIGGTPSVTGLYQVTVTATDSGGARGNVQFSWFVY